MKVFFISRLAIMTTTFLSICYPLISSAISFSCPEPAHIDSYLIRDYYRWVDNTNPLWHGAPFYDTAKPPTTLTTAIAVIPPVQRWNGGFMSCHYDSGRMTPHAVLPLLTGPCWFPGSTEYTGGDKPNIPITCHNSTPRGCTLTCAN